MSRSILVLAGSPRKNSNAALLAEAFSRGAQEAGNNVQTLALRELTLKPCLACDYCRKNAGRCVLKDDMGVVYDALKRAELLVFATPLHFYSFSTSLKTAIDRLYNKPIRDALPVRETLLLTVGADGENAFAPLIATYRAIGGFLGWKDAGVIAVPHVAEAGAIAGNKALEEAFRLGKSLV